MTRASPACGSTFGNPLVRPGPGLGGFVASDSLPRHHGLRPFGIDAPAAIPEPSFLLPGLGGFGVVPGRTGHGPDPAAYRERCCDIPTICTTTCL